MNTSKARERFSLVVTGLVYLLFNYRYARGEPVASLIATLEQLLTTAPYVAGLTYLVVYFLQRMSGERLPWDRTLRIFFTVGIIIAFFYALNDYWLRGQAVP